MSVHMMGGRVVVGGIELTGQVRATALAYGADALEDTNLSSTTHTFTGGLKTVAFSHEGYWNAGTTASTDALDSAQFAQIGTAGTVVSAAVSSSEGAVAYAFQSLFTDYTPRGSLGELIGYNVSAAANGNPLIRGITLWDSTAVSSTALADGASTGTAYDLSASASSEKYVYGALHVMTATSSGATGVEVLIQSDNSSAFGSPTTVMTFTQTTAAGPGSAEWASTALGSTDTWFRAINNAASSDSRYSIHLTLGFSSNN